MIHEMRTYRLRVGALPEFIRLVGEEGILIQQRHLGRLVGYFSTEIGLLNGVVHLWEFKDLEDREQRRAKLATDPEWQQFMPKIQPLIETMENQILRPTPFSPLQ